MHREGRPKAGKTANESVSSDSRSTIVLVETDRALRDVMTLALQRAGFEVAFEEHPAETLSTIRAKRPFLVVLDLFLPHISGLDILKQMEPSLRAHFWIFTLSALGFPEVVQQAQKAGARDFLLKPIDTDLLVEKVQQAWKEARFLEPWD
jgi:DNA-binding NtrC family response regulator